MGGHARHIGLPHEHVPITDVKPIHQNLATAYCVLAFGWMIYRATEDGATLLGLEHPWDHMHHDHPSDPVFLFAEASDDDEDEDEEEEDEDEE
ncbi:unnamed protein product [Sphacelaria rigidula]